MMLLSYFAASTWMLANLASAGDVSSTFQIYAYGPSIGGVPLFSTGANAYLGNFTLANNSEAAPVVFELKDDLWLGSPNTTQSDSPTWSNHTFFVPDSTSSSHAVGFFSGTNPPSDGLTTFNFYGEYIFGRDSSGNLNSLWYTKPSDSGVYTLKWNATGDDDADIIRLTLKATPPSDDEE